MAALATSSSALARPSATLAPSPARAASSTRALVTSTTPRSTFVSSTLPRSSLAPVGLPLPSSSSLALVASASSASLPSITPSQTAAPVVQATATKSPLVPVLASIGGVAFLGLIGFLLYRRKSRRSAASDPNRDFANLADSRGARDGGDKSFYGGASQHGRMGEKDAYNDGNTRQKGILKGGVGFGRVEPLSTSRADNYNSPGTVSSGSYPPTPQSQAQFQPYNPNSSTAQLLPPSEGSPFADQQFRTAPPHPFSTNSPAIYAASQGPPQPRGTRTALMQDGRFPGAAGAGAGMWAREAGREGANSPFADQHRAPEQQVVPSISIAPAPPSAGDSPFAEPSEEGTVHLVRRTFEPSMGDELVISPGDRVRLLMAYDDGWALGINLEAPMDANGSPHRGVFPFDCLEEKLYTDGPKSGFSPLTPTPLIGSTGLPPNMPLSITTSQSRSADLSPPVPTGRVPSPSYPFPLTPNSHHPNLDQYAGSSKTPQLAPLASTESGSFMDARSEDRREGEEKDGRKRISSLVKGRDQDLYDALGRI